jgi:hypothetical protein
VGAVAHLRALAGWLPVGDGPLLVDCLVTPEVHGPWMQGAFNRSLR